MSPDRAARTLGVAAIGLGALALSSLGTIPDLLVWNASQSVREGLYFVEPWAQPVKGDLAAAWASDRARALAAQRLYVPASVPLIKPVAAIEGDRVCALGPQIDINGRRAVTRARTDLSGRRMPWWSGCERLGDGEVLLLAPAPGSFDGRYFGASRRNDILGKAVLLWGR